MEAKIDKILIGVLDPNLQEYLEELLLEKGVDFFTATISPKWEDEDYYLTDFRVLGTPVDFLQYSTLTTSGKVLEGYQALSKQFVVEKSESYIKFSH